MLCPSTPRECDTVEYMPSPEHVPDVDRLLDPVRYVDNQLIELRTDVQTKIALVFEKIAALEVGVKKLDTRADNLERREENLEHRAAKIEHREDDLEMELEGRQLSEGPVVSGVSSYEELVDKHQAKKSVMERKQRGITVDFLELEATEIYEFNESTWDIAIFIGTPSLGLGGSILTFVLLLMNVIMQLVFVGIVFYNFSDAQVNQEMIDSAQAWRLGMAHDMSFLTGDSGPSLVARVCAGDMSLQTATAQQNLFSYVSDYLKPDAKGFESIFVGRALCIVAMVCWYLMVSREMHTAMDLSRAIVNLPSGPDKLEPVELPMQPTRYRVASMPRIRKTYSVLIVVYRILVAIMLGFCGTYFLAYTIEITELVLNAVALEIILNIDDLLFDAVTTANARHMVQRLDPVRMPRWPHRSGMDLKAAFMAALIPISVIVVDMSLIKPMLEDLSAVAEALCGGNKDFVYSKNVLQLYEMAPTTPYNAGASGASATMAHISRQAISEATRQSTREQKAASKFAIWSEAVRYLRISTGLPFEDAIARATEGKCTDQLEGPLLSYLRHFLGDPSIRNCADVADWCSSPSFFPQWNPDGGRGLAVRMICPQTCECDQPFSSIFFQSGCPAFCTSLSHPRFFHALNVSRCQQQDTESTRKSALWVKWASQVRVYGNFSGDQNYISMADAMLTQGCQALTQGSIAQKCHWIGKNAPFKTAANICPRQCFCQKFSNNGYRVPSCPLECDVCAMGRRRRGFGKKSKTGPNGKIRNCQFNFINGTYPACSGDTHLNCPNAKTSGWACERTGQFCDQVGGNLGDSKHR